jgi:hypothetical protein
MRKTVGTTEGKRGRNWGIDRKNGEKKLVNMVKIVENNRGKM